MMYIFINNKFYEKENAYISVFDHGLLYGDGVFETLRTYNGIVFKINEHLKRIFASAKHINLLIPLTKEDLKKAVYNTIKKNNLKSAYIRITITRGKGDIGYASECKPNLIIITEKLIPYNKEIYKNGVAIITYKAERFLPEVKSTNCLPLVLAKTKAEKNKSFDAILIDRDGYVREGTVSNIFFIKGNRIFTPYNKILYGITRDIVLQLAKKFVVNETAIKKSQVMLFNECFLTNTTAEIVPVVRIDNKVIGNGIPGNITKYLMKEFRKYVGKEISKEELQDNDISNHLNHSVYKVVGDIRRHQSFLPKNFGG